MKNKVRVGILGIGGVGGYFGGLLANYYTKSDNFEIIFIARGETLRVIANSGLKIIKSGKELITNPHLVSDQEDIIGELDYLIISTKSYDLLNSLDSYKKCIKSSTVIIPLLNGVEARAQISDKFPDLEVWDACVYIVARIVSPGVIAVSGNNQLFYFGSKHADPKKLLDFEIFLKDASINATLSEDIEQTIWEKFIFISSIASLTSYLDKSIGEILSINTYKESLIKLLTEIVNLATVKKIKLSDQFLDKLFERMNKMPPETTSSMHYDFKNGKKTEYQTLTEFVVREAELNYVKCQEYKNILEALKLKSK